MDYKKYINLMLDEIDDPEALEAILWLIQKFYLLND